MKREEKEWTCKKCRTKHDRDINADEEEMNELNGVILEKFAKLDVPTKLECHRLILDIEN